jgi:hypothetical protein
MPHRRATRKGRGGVSVPNAQLLEDVADVLLGGSNGQAQRLGDFAIGEPSGDQGEYLALSPGQPRGPRKVSRGVRRPDHEGKLSDRDSRQRTWQGQVAVHHAQQSSVECFGRDVTREVPGRSPPETLQNRILIHMVREGDNSRSRSKIAADLADQLEARLIRQAEINEDDVRSGRREPAARIVGTRNSGDRLEVIAAKRTLELGAEKRAVFDEHDSRRTWAMLASSGGHSPPYVHEFGRAGLRYGAVSTLLRGGLTRAAT